MNLSYLYSNYFFSSPNILRVIKSRNMQRAGFVAGAGAKRNAYEILVEKCEREDTLKF
jgi:hypothetical protein